MPPAPLIYSQAGFYWENPLMFWVLEVFCIFPRDRNEEMEKHMHEIHFFSLQENVQICIIYSFTGCGYSQNFEFILIWLGILTLSGRFLRAVFSLSFYNALIANLSFSISYIIMRVWPSFWYTTFCYLLTSPKRGIGMTNVE